MSKHINLTTTGNYNDILYTSEKKNTRIRIEYTYTHKLCITKKYTLLSTV